MIITISAENIINFPKDEWGKFNKLIEIFNLHSVKNKEKNRYYEGNISLNEVNLGIALPDNMSKLEIGCSWGAKTVDVLAARSMFDGFVGINGEYIELLDEITIKNNLVAEYMKACRDELKLGCTFATLAADKKLKCKIRFHSPMSAAALWNGEKNEIDCGFAIIDTVPDNEEYTTWSPSVINYYTDKYIWVMTCEAGIWSAIPYKHKMGKPMMVALIWNATTDKPFGRSRIKEPIRRLIQGYVRTIANATIGLEFATSPQKYLLGVTDEQFDAVVNDKFRQYVGSIMTSTVNPETGEKPTFGQLTQGTLAPHVEMLRILATQYSAATGLSVTDTGVVSEANPTSADAVIAQTQTLIGMAEQLNAGNGDALRNIALMALAVVNDTSLDDLSDEDKAIVAHFKNPAMPSVAATTDAALKLASAREGFANTDVFLEMVGFDKADIRRIKNQERQMQSRELVSEFISEPDEEDLIEEDLTEEGLGDEDDFDVDSEIDGLLAELES